MDGLLFRLLVAEEGKIAGHIAMLEAGPRAWALMAEARLAARRLSC
jgi:hypothetical protein